MKVQNQIDQEHLLDLCHHAIAWSMIDDPIRVQNMQEDVRSMVWGEYYDELMFCARRYYDKFGNPEWMNVVQYIDKQ